MNHHGAIVVALCATAACCAGSTRTSTGGDLALAERYQRGDGVPRDYRHAVTLLERACARGDGDPVACRELGLAKLSARGTSRDASAEALLRVACRRGDWLACGGPIAFDEAAARAACDAGKQPACLAIAGTFALSQGGSVQAERWHYLDAACRAGVLEGCLAIMAVADDASEPSTAAARERLTSACGRGHVDACAAVGTPFAPEALCAAGDYGACAVAGAAGDVAALETACVNRITEACEQIALQAIAAEPPDPRAVEYIRRACRAGSARACEFDRPEDVRSGCVAYAVVTIVPSQRRRVPHLHGVDVGGRPWTAPAGPLVLLAHPESVPWPTLDVIAHSVAVPVVVVVDRSQLGVVPRLERAVVVALDSSFTAEPVVQPGASMLSPFRVGQSTLIIDRDDVPRVVFQALPTAPATFARCVRHQLELL